MKNLKAIEFVQSELRHCIGEIETAGKKRIEDYASYVTFQLENEMAHQVEFKVLMHILELLKSYNDTADYQTQQYKEYLTRSVQETICFSTSQGANLFKVIRRNVYKEMLKSGGTFDAVLRTLNKQDGN